MYPKIKKSTLIVILLFCFLSVSVSANSFHYHILNAGINLGWAEGTIQRLGVTPATTPYLTGVLVNATAHLTAAQELVNGMYWERIQLTSVNPEILSFIASTSTYTQIQQASYIRNIRVKIKTKLAQAFIRGRLISTPSCDSYMFLVGYFFGQAQIGAFVGNSAYRGAAHGIFLDCIRDGLDASRRLRCTFGTRADWDGLPFSRPPYSAADYANVLYPMQVLAWRLGGFLTPPPPAAPPSLPPLPLPASTGSSSPTIRNTSGVYDPSGRWQRGDMIVEIRKEGDTYKGFLIKVPSVWIKFRYWTGELIWKLKFRKTDHTYINGSFNVPCVRYNGNIKSKGIDGRITWNEESFTLTKDVLSYLLVTGSVEFKRIIAIR